MTKINFEKVIVEWLDIQSCEDAWSSAEDFKKLLPATCTTIGYLYENNQNFVKTFATFSMNDDEEQSYDYGDCIVIPKGCVVSIKKIDN